MRNRAKCKLCKTVIEAFYANDYVSCKCGEIAVEGVESLRCFATHWENFLRIDDEGNEIIVNVRNSNMQEKENVEKPNKKDIIDMLDEMINSYEKLPQHVMMAPITHSDFVSALLLISSILRAD